jgi:hypothetical protein
MPNNTDSFDYTLDDLVTVPFTSTIPVNTGGFSASVLTAGSGLNGTSWTSIPYTVSTTTGANPMMVGSSGMLDLNGENADIRINGRSLGQAIASIEERLAILHPDPELEKEWEDLKQLGNQYRTLEAEIKEKMRVWDILKRTDT